MKKAKNILCLIVLIGSLSASAYLHRETRILRGANTFDKCVNLHGEGDAACEGCYFLLIENGVTNEPKPF